MKNRISKLQIILGLVFPIAFILSLCIYGIWAAGIEERDRAATYIGLGNILFFCILSVYACFEDLIKTKISLERARFWDFHEKTLINALAESEVKSKTEIAKNLKKAGVSPKIIAETTGLNMEEIERIK